ncbi:MAG: hypothetical protein ACTSUE_14030 [Promethearchaeota archaeon]
MGLEYATVSAEIFQTPVLDVECVTTQTTVCVKKDTVGLNARSIASIIAMELLKPTRSSVLDMEIVLEMMSANAQLDTLECGVNSIQRGRATVFKIIFLPLVVTTERVNLKTNVRVIQDIMGTNVNTRWLSATAIIQMILSFAQNTVLAD